MGVWLYEGASIPKGFSHHFPILGAVATSGFLKDWWSHRASVMARDQSALGTHEENRQGRHGTKLGFRKGSNNNQQTTNNKKSATTNSSQQQQQQQQQEQQQQQQQQQPHISYLFVAVKDDIGWVKNTVYQYLDVDTLYMSSVFSPWLWWWVGWRKCSSMYKGHPNRPTISCNKVLPRQKVR